VPEAVIRVILADDHAIVLDGLHRLFERQHDIKVLACCRTGEDALAEVRRGEADVLVLDLRLPGLGGLEVLQMMTAARLRCRVVLLTAAIADADAVIALRHGAAGLVLKESSPDALLECVRRVHQGEQWIDHQTMGRALDRMLRQETANRDAAKLLTPREMEIVRLVAQGHRNRIVAERLSISEGTVKIHLHNVYQKLEIDGRFELLRWVQERGLV
jgi:DNA-binding NarL/FixJ family response regulator